MVLKDYTIVSIKFIDFHEVAVVHKFLEHALSLIRFFFFYKCTIILKKRTWSRAVNLRSGTSYCVITLLHIFTVLNRCCFASFFLSLFFYFPFLIKRYAIVNLKSIRWDNKKNLHETKELKKKKNNFELMSFEDVTVAFRSAIHLKLK